MFERRAGRDPPRDPVGDRGGNPLWNESRSLRGCPKVGAASGGTAQNAAKAVVMGGISRRSSRTVTAKGTSDRAACACGIQRAGGHGSSKEGLQQERIKREHAKCEAPSPRTLAETPHFQARNRCRYGDLIS